MHPMTRFLWDSMTVLELHQQAEEVEHNRDRFVDSEEPDRIIAEIEAEIHRRGAA